MTQPTGAELAAMSEPEFAAFIRDSGIRTVSSADPDPEPLPESDPRRQEWVARIAAGSTPKRELVDGRFVGWIDSDRRPSDPQKRGAA